MLGAFVFIGFFLISLFFILLSQDETRCDGGGTVFDFLVGEQPVIMVLYWICLIGTVLAAAFFCVNSFG